MQDNKPRAYALYDAISALEGLDPNEKCLLFIFASHARPDGSHAYPGITRLMKRMNRSKAQVIRLIKRLVDLKLLVPAGKVGYTDCYNIQLSGITPVYTEDTATNLTAIHSKEIEEGAAALQEAFEEEETVVLPAIATSAAKKKVWKTMTDEEVMAVARRMKTMQLQGLKMNYIKMFAARWEMPEEALNDILNMAPEELGLQPLQPMAN